MKTMTSRLALMLAGSALMLAPAAQAQQSPRELATMAGAPAAPAGWEVPRTQWGDPDLRGIWPIDSVGQTPTERPPNLGDKAYLTDEEYQAALDAAENTAAGYEREDEEGTIGAGHWFEWGQPLKQTSLIMEPANGRIPALTEEGERRSAGMESSWSQDVFDDLADFNSLDKCISRGLPSSMVPFPYNNGIRVFQSPGFVVLQLEIVHETRVIPIGDGPQHPDEIRQWLGQSRGYWDGDTLVIETTNLTGQTPLNIVGPGNKPLPTSDQQTVTERLTPVGPNTLFYEAWIRDPVVLTEPFKMAFPWSRDDSYEMFEYACHEGNTVVRNYITATSPRFNPDAGESMSAAEWVGRTVTGDVSDEED